MRNPRRLVPLTLVVAAFAVSAVAFPYLPVQLPMHWGLSGSPDRFGGRIEGAFAIPFVMAAIWLLLTLVPRYDRLLFIKYDSRDSDASTVRPIYDRMVVIMLVMLLAIHAFIVTSSLGLVAAPHQPVLLAAIGSLGAILVGNYMPRVTRRNAFIGFRVPWAYASEEAWRRTQRVGGYGMVAAGTVGLVGAVAVPSAPLKPFFVAMIVQLTIVAAYSYYLAHSRTVN